MSFYGEDDRVDPRLRARRESARRAKVETPFEEENLGGALIGGAVGAGIGTIVWALFGAMSGVKISLLAIAIGGLAGFGVRTLGHGRTPLFQLIAVVYAFLGLLLGNAFIVAVFVNQKTGASVVGLLFKPKLYMAVLQHSSPMDYLFYAIAIYFAWQFATQSDEL